MGGRGKGRCLLLGGRASWLLLYARVSYDVGVWSARRLEILVCTPKLGLEDVVVFF